MTHTAQNYPGGFVATEIIVFLYFDGRTNFVISKCEEYGRLQLSIETQRDIKRCKSLIHANTEGKTWGEIVKWASEVADKMRGCTWEEWKEQKQPNATQLQLI